MRMVLMIPLVCGLVRVSWVALVLLWTKSLSVMYFRRSSGVRSAS